MNVTRVKLEGPGNVSVSGMSVELGLELTAGRIERAVVSLEGESTAPWRVGAAEVALEGQVANDSLFQVAADRILEDAHAQTGRGSHIGIGRRVLVDALHAAAFGPQG